MNNWLSGGAAPVGFAGAGGPLGGLGDPYGVSLVPYFLKSAEAKVAYDEQQLAKWRATKPNVFHSQRKIEAEIAKWRQRLKVDKAQLEEKLQTAAAKAKAKRKGLKNVVADAAAGLIPGLTTAPEVADLYAVPEDGGLVSAPSSLVPVLSWGFGIGAVLLAAVAAFFLLRRKTPRRRKK